MQGNVEQVFRRLNCVCFCLRFYFKPVDLLRQQRLKSRCLTFVVVVKIKWLLVTSADGI